MGCNLGECPPLPAPPWCSAGAPGCLIHRMCTVLWSLRPLYCAACVYWVTALLHGVVAVAQDDVLCMVDEDWVSQGGLARTML